MPLSSTTPTTSLASSLVNSIKILSPKTVSKVQFFNAKNVKIIELEGKQRSLSSHGGYSVKMSWDVPPPSVKLIIHGKNLKVVPFDVRLCSRGGELGKGPRIRRCELRKIEDEESDHGRHMKGFNKLKVREPMSRVVENDADTVSQRKDDDNLDEVGPFNIFVRGSSFMLS
ncbi:hypothetical protein NC652_024668 [Populus alba x Populus x berolinensis]|nr:hypothetical protein NC652_024668 [Populus alba x Populus x berolinensis]